GGKTRGGSREEFATPHWYGRHRRPGVYLRTGVGVGRGRAARHGTRRGPGAGQRAPGGQGDCLLQESSEPRFPHRSFARHRFVPVLPTIVIVTASPVVYLTPPTYGPAAYHDSPGIDASGSEAYAPPLPVAPAPPPSMPSVVEYPTGRYELRGDGEASPYTWVWVPKPPPAAPP